MREPSTIQDVLRRCSSSGEFLVHLYWPNRMNYFERCAETFSNGGTWLLVATPHHGVRQPQRPTINFLVADREFAKLYEEAARARGFQHGIMVRRSTIEELGRRRGYELADIEVGHPNRYGVTDPEHYWRFDVGNYRFGVLNVLQFATVVRLATPQQQEKRRIELSFKSIVGWW